MRTALVKSAARVLDLLELLAATPRPLRLSAIARRLGAPRSSALALLATLVAKGYAEEVEGGYRLVLRLREHGWVGGDRALLIDRARPVMARLAATSGESAFLGVLTREFEVAYLVKSLSASPIRYDGDLDQPRPAFCTSIGQILLADMTEADLDAYLARTPLLACTPSTPTDPGRIRALLRAARGRGFAHTVDGHVVGAAGVAAAIRGADGRAVAGLAVIGPSWRFGARMEAHAREVVAAAAEISLALAGGGGPVRQAS